MNAKRECKPWSRNQVDELIEQARTYNKNWALIGPALGRTAEACKQKFNEEERRRRQRPLPMRRKSGADGRTLMKSATDVAAEARRQMASLPPRSLTAELFNDPPAGRSALDEKRAAGNSPIRSVSLAGALR